MAEPAKAFVDSHIFMDFYHDRKDSIRPLGEFAFQFFKKAIECRHVVLVCKETIEELCRILEFSENEVWGSIFSGLKNKDKILVVESSESQMIEAGLLSRARNVPAYDALFAVLARDNGALLVSRDEHHREKLLDVAQPLMPEELL